MAKLSTLEMDPDLIEQGKRFPWKEDVVLIVASVRNQAYQEHVRALCRPHLAELRSEHCPPGRRLEIIKPAVARHLLKGWENLQDDEGREIVYSPEKALELLNNPRLPSLCEDVLNFAGDDDRYRQQLLEDAEKNS